MSLDGKLHHVGSEHTVVDDLSCKRKGLWHGSNRRCRGSDGSDRSRHNRFCFFPFEKFQYTIYKEKNKNGPIIFECEDMDTCSDKCNIGNLLDKFSALLEELHSKEIRGNVSYEEGEETNNSHPDKEIGMKNKGRHLSMIICYLQEQPVNCNKPKTKNTELFSPSYQEKRERIDDIDKDIFDIDQDRILGPSLDKIRHSIRKFPILSVEITFWDDAEWLDKENNYQKRPSFFSKKFLQFSQGNEMEEGPSNEKKSNNDYSIIGYPSKDSIEYLDKLGHTIS